MKILLVTLGLLLLSSCGISGKIDRTITTYPDGKIVDSCSAEYYNYSFGTATSRGVHGCEAGGESKGVDNTATLQIPIQTFQTIIGAIK